MRIEKDYDPCLNNVPLHIRKNSVCIVAQSCKSCVHGIAHLLIPLPPLPRLHLYGFTTGDGFFLSADSIRRGGDPSFENDLCLFPSKFALSSPPSPSVCTLISCSVEHRGSEGEQLASTIRGILVKSPSSGETLLT